RTMTHLDLSDVLPGDVLIGTLPVHLAAEVCSRGARYLHLTLLLPAGVAVSSRPANWPIAARAWLNSALAASSVPRKTPSRHPVLASQACQFGRAGRQPLSCPRDCVEQCMSERDPSPFIRVPNRLRTTPRIFQQTFRVNLCYFPTAAKGDFPILLLTRWRDGYFPPASV